MMSFRWTSTCENTPHRKLHKQNRYFPYFRKVIFSVLLFAWLVTAVSKSKILHLQWCSPTIVSRPRMKRWKVSVKAPVSYISLTFSLLGQSYSIPGFLSPHMHWLVFPRKFSIGSWWEVVWSRVAINMWCWIIALSDCNTNAGWVDDSLRTRHVMV